jgi:hypothetical protein
MKYWLFMVAGVTLLQVDTWILQTMWLGLAGAMMMIYSMYLGVSGEEK